MKEPLWLIEARKYVGLAEIPGSRHNSVIVGWLKSLKAWWAEDETPWCGVFVAHCIKTANLPYPTYYMRAKDWATWGKGISKPTLGCVVVFERAGGGHVGFVVGTNANGNLMVIGGNQGNKVSIAAFDRSRVVAYRVPLNDSTTTSSLPLLTSSGKLSTNEA